MAIVSRRTCRSRRRCRAAVCPGPAGVDRRGGGARAGEEPRRSLAGHGVVRPGDGAAGCASGSPTAPRSGGGGLLGTYEVGEPLGPGRLGSTVHRGVHRALGHPVAIRILRGVHRPRRGGARALPPRGPLAAGRASVDHPRPRLRRRRRPRLRRHRLHRRPEHAPAADRVRCRCRGRGCRGSSTQLLEAAHVLHRRKGLLCGLSPDIVRIADRRRRRAADDLERRDLGCAGSARDAAGPDAARDGARRRRSCATSRRSCSPAANADVRSDVFTLGVLIYEMATGVLPFDGATLPELLGQDAERRAPRDPRELQPTLPERAAAARSRPRSAARRSSGSHGAGFARRSWPPFGQTGRAHELGEPATDRSRWRAEPAGERPRVQFRVRTIG